MSRHISSLIICSIVLLSCKNREINYITYYNKVNEIDSIYRIANKPEKAVRKYRKLFRNYSPKNQERIEEYETYIKLADKYHKNFGGQKSLYKLIPLVAPYGEKYKNLFSLYDKYGIDSLKVKNEITNWKKTLNSQLVDSFTVAMIRDQGHRLEDTLTHKLVLKKNSELLIWTFKNYGFPTQQKIGLFGKNNVMLVLPSLIDHMSESTYYPYFKTKLLDYVKSGDCHPYIYAVMVDKHNLNFTQGKESILYGAYRTTGLSLDSVQINHNRKSIGLPSLKHYERIKKDFHKK